MYVAAVLAGFILFHELHLAEKLGLVKSRFRIIQDKAQEINSHTPVTVDQFTTLLAMDVANDGVLFRYRTTAAASHAAGAEKFLNQMKMLLWSKACSDPNVAAILKNGFSVSYSYVDSNEKSLGTVLIPTSMCK
jgi:hypothetical protein